MLVSPLTQLGTGEPLVLHFRHPSDSPVYFMCGLAANASTVIIPGVEIPAGGLEVVRTVGADACDVDLFYYTSTQL